MSAHVNNINMHANNRSLRMPFNNLVETKVRRSYKKTYDEKMPIMRDIKNMEYPGIDPGTSHMLSERSTT